MHIDTQALINWLRADSAWQHAIAVRDHAECEIEARAHDQAEAGKALCRAIGLDPGPFSEVECYESEVRVFAHGRRYTIRLNGDVTIKEVRP
ncbi:hypothetical protein U5801_11660 [Lamprobacter modestohalophilus]|uniref:hypothetical protein n=1 Tax=Lamprobacter modestohalophilus TaxID=1064514 RepID=UPI002ADEDFF5|nr:hypothetical protein [Lamprobacter modestohalophilus]MEA1050460.1 hypothetical protein [Lamprobacter modestohalophilus]